MGRARATGLPVFCAIASFALILAVFPAPHASAAPTVKAAEEAREAAVVQLMIIERRAADTERQIADAKRRLEELQAEIEKTTHVAERAAADLESVQSRYTRRVVETYKAGGTGWLGLLLDSDDLSQFIGRTLMLGRILDQDAALADQIAEARSEAEEASRLAREAARTQEEELTRLTAQQDSLRQTKKEQSALVATLGERLVQAKAAAAEAERRMAEANASARQSQSVSTTNRISAPVPTTTQSTTSTPAPGGGRQLRVKAWAYALPGTTATGLPVARGIVAVDPRVIPLGTRLYIPGYGEGLAADTGRDIKGNIIDLWMASLAEARAWGTRYVTITIYD
jgi:3D (Asp-Asp-Asp) domain-containing protein